MSFSLLSIAIIAVTAAVIYREVRKGYRHGLSRSLISLSILIFCAVFASLVSVWITKPIGALVIEILRSTGVLNLLSGTLALFVGIVKMLVNIIISLLLFLPTFYILRALVTYLVKIIIAAVTAKSNKGRSKGSAVYLSEDAPFYVVNDKKLGALVGALSGFIIAVVVFMPLMGLLKSADDIADTLKEMTDIPAVENSKGLDILDRYANDASGTVLYTCGGGVIYDITTRTNAYGYTSCLNDEIKAIRETNLTETAVELYESGAITLENSEIIEKFLDKVDRSLFLKLVMADVLKNVSSRWLEYQPYMGIARPSFSSYSEIDNFFNSVLYVCTSTSIETYDADIRTIVALIRIFEEYPILNTRDYKSFMTDFVEENALQSIEAELRKNPHMNSVHVAIDDLIMNIIASEFELEKYSLSQKTNLYNGIASVLNDARGLSGYVKSTAIANGISEKFESCGVYVPSNLENRIANLLSYKLSDSSELTGTAVESIFEEYMKEKDQGEGDK